MPKLTPEDRTKRLGNKPPAKIIDLVVDDTPKKEKVVPLLNIIKADQLTSRKSHNNSKSSLLTTLLGEIETIISRQVGTNTATDIEVVAVIKKFIKANNDNIDIITDKNSAMVVNAIRDNQLLATYLPAQLTDDVMRAFALRIIKDEQDVRMSMMGVIMKKLNATYPGQVDGKAASAVVRAILQENISG